MNSSLTSHDTVNDFSSQWTKFTTNPGYYGSPELILDDIFSPLLSPATFKNARVCEIGAGTGRIASVVAASGSKSVLAYEPSAGADAIKNSDNLIVKREKGENVINEKDLDIVYSIGVLHHIKNPEPVTKAAYKALKPGGTMFVWLYGKEGNRLYITLVRVLRMISLNIPDRLLWGLCLLAVPFLRGYGLFTKFLKFLPFAEYFNNYLMNLSTDILRLTVFDQLNPQYAKYYTKRESIALLEDAGFKEVKVYHRHGYSWSAIGTKPTSGW